MKKRILHFLILVVGCFFLQCNKENIDPVLEEVDPDDFEVMRYKFGNITSSNKILPLITYKDLEKQSKITFYGKYEHSGDLDSDVVDQITQMVCENGSALPTILSFNTDGKINSIYQQDPNTGLVENKILFMYDYGVTYYKKQDGTTGTLTESENFELPPNYDIDALDALIHNTLNENQSILNHFNKKVMEQGNKRISIFGVDDALIIGIVVAGVVIYKTVKFIQNKGISKITQDSEIESNNLTELCDKFQLFGQRRAFNSSSSYMCSESSKLEDEREKNHEEMLSICYDKICLIDCNGVQGGTAFLDECEECVGGDTEKEACTVDCNGVLGGTAFLDECEECVGGDTGKKACFNMEMVSLSGGKFYLGKDSMGKDYRENNDKDGELVYKSVSSFTIGKYEVTQGQWKLIMGSNPSKSHSDSCDSCPVERVSWYDVQVFINKLNAYTGKNYRLPTEAEWQYAARGGSNSKYSGSNNIGSVAWYKDNARDVTRPVGQKQANGFGLYDMSGNVMEWCNDWYAYHYDYTSPNNWYYESATNPRGPSSGIARVFRGGSCANWAANCGVGYRSYSAPDFRYSYVGFRLCLSL